MVNFGSSPHDINDVQDLWYALREIGFIDQNGEDPTVSIEGNVTASDAFGDTEFGEVVGVPTNTTETIVNKTISDESAVVGFTANGESDGKYRLRVNGNLKLSQVANQSSPNATINMNNGIEIDTNDTVKLTVENIGLDSSDYEGAILLQL